MSDHVLKAKSVLGDYKKSFGDTVLEEVTGLGIVSIATSLDGEAALATAVHNAFGTSMPKTGSFTTSKDGSIRFLGFAPEQIFALVSGASDNAEGGIKAGLGDVGYFTDQTDNWVMLRLSGKLAAIALERICAVDLHPANFTEVKVVRTMMEHLNVVMLRDGEDGYLLMSARSSANSFLHAIETSLKNVHVD